MAASSTAVRRRAPARWPFWSRIGIVALVALAIVAAGAWIYAASLLWRTSVPGDLRIPELRATDYFSQRALDDAADIADVLTGGELWHDTAPLAVDVDLRGHDVRADQPAIV